MEINNALYQIISKTPYPKTCFEIINNDIKILFSNNEFKRVFYDQQLISLFYTKIQPILKDLELYEKNHTSIISFNSNQNYLVNLYEISPKKYICELLKENISNQSESHQSYFQSIIDNVGGIIYRCQASDPFSTIYISNHIKKITGYDKQYFENINERRYNNLIDSTHLQNVLQATEKGIKNKTYWEIEYPIIHKDGHRVWVFEKSKAIYDEAGNPIFIDGLIVDITKQKELEESLLNEKHVIQELNHRQTEFLTKISHEIRTPLNIILGMSTILYDTKITREQKELIDSIKASSQHVSNLVSDLINFSSFDLENFKLIDQKFNLKNLLQTIKASFEYKYSNKDIDFEIWYESKLAENVIGDKSLLNQILVELIKNAYKFTEKGTISIIVKKISDSHYQFKVTDTGIGIKEEHQNTIFEKFEQINNSSVDNNSGIGLGLAHIKNLLNKIECNINLISEEHSGATFIFNFPITEIDFKETYTIDSENSGIQKVLVVEDNQLNQKYLIELLKKENIPYDIANNGQEAIDLCEKIQYSLIFMDIQMPIKNGLEATLEIRNSNNYNKNTPIIALTASSLLEENEFIEKINMNGSLMKPFTSEQFYSILFTYINNEVLKNEIKE